MFPLPNVSLSQFYCSLICQDFTVVDVELTSLKFDFSRQPSTGSINRGIKKQQKTYICYVLACCMRKNEGYLLVEGDVQYLTEEELLDKGVS